MASQREVSSSNNGGLSDPLIASPIRPPTIVPISLASQYEPPVRVTDRFAHAPLDPSGERNQLTRNSIHSKPTGTGGSLSIAGPSISARQPSDRDRNAAESSLEIAGLFAGRSVIDLKLFEQRGWGRERSAIPRSRLLKALLGPRRR